jgi:hypothetical protein
MFMIPIQIVFFLGGLLGILTHNLMKIDSLNRKANGDFKFKPFLRLEWPSLSISVIVVILCTVGQVVIPKLQAVGLPLIFGFYTIGLAAQSLAYYFKGRAEKAIAVMGDSDGIEKPKID